MLHAIRLSLGATIGRKITLVVLAAVLVAVTTATSFYISRQTSQNLQSRYDSLTATATVFAATISPAVAEGDRTRALVSMRAIGLIEAIPFIAVTLPDGRLFTSLGNAVVVSEGVGLAPSSGPAASKSLLSLVFNPTLEIKVPVINGGRTVGDVRMLADISDLRAQLFEGIAAAIIAALFASVLGLGVAHQLKTAITSPLGELTRVIRAVREEHDFSLRARHTSEDETGQLVDAFNEMLDQIAERDQSLARHRAGLEQTVRERTRDLRHAKQAAEQANEAKSAFLATMSHEIRTPMNGMLVMAELLAAGELQAAQKRYADVIVRSGHSLLTIINDLLDLSKIEAGKLRLEPLPVSPTSLVDDTVALFWERASSKQVALVSFVSPRMPATIEADPVRLSQILSNLVNNAIKFTSHGHVGVSARVVAASDGTDCLELAVTDTGIGIEPDKLETIFDAFSQADASTTRRFGGTGLGLSICQRLVTVMGGTIEVASRPGQGSRFTVRLPISGAVPARLPGLSASPLAPAVICLEPAAAAAALERYFTSLGLPVRTVASADLADARDGTSCVLTDATTAQAAGLASPDGSSRPRLILAAALGSSAAEDMLRTGAADDLFTLPFNYADLAELAGRMASGRMKGASEARPVVTAQALPSFRGLRVLVADDNAVNREVMAEVLRRLGASFDLVEHGAAAVEAWSGSARYDIVFMDCSMPVMDGFEATRRIRAAERSAAAAPVPIIALTAHLEGTSESAWRDAGMDERIVKPFTIARIAQALAQCSPQPAGKAAADAPPADAVDTGGEPAAEAGPPAGPGAPVIDPVMFASLRDMSDDGDRFIREIAGLFQTHTPSALARIRQAQEDEAGGQLADAAHALKSMAASIGAVRLATACADLERVTRAGEPADVGALVSRISEELTAAVQALTPMLDIRAAG